MSRKNPVAGPTISLFPFLAVLLCTMGALLVVLVLFSRSVRQNETAKLDQEQESLVEELELARDGLAWRREQLEGVRERTAEDLAKARVQLAGVEENTRALQDEFANLERTAAALASTAGVVAADDETLRGLQERLTSARESLDKARAEGKTKPPAYAVVPYAGRNGTHRRPLYIECCGDGVFLQPEGIRLSPGDFEGPPGPGNPLASALRAAREHVVAAQGGTNDPAAQPYPLLLVRPSGVMAYYAAREAIQSWGSDFGYQLIDEDWTLTFPPADPTLAQVEKRAIDESRARLAWLAEVRPARPAKPTQQYRAAPTRGGVVADGGPSVLGDQSRWDWANQQQAGGGAPGGGFNAGSGVGGSGSGSGAGRGAGAGGDASGDRSTGSRWTSTAARGGAAVERRPAPAGAGSVAVARARVVRPPMRRWLAAVTTALRSLSATEPRQAAMAVQQSAAMVRPAPMVVRQAVWPVREPRPALVLVPAGLPLPAAVRLQREVRAAATVRRVARRVVAVARQCQGSRGPEAVPPGRPGERAEHRGRGRWPSRVAKTGRASPRRTGRSRSRDRFAWSARCRSFGCSTIRAAAWRPASRWPATPPRRSIHS
jgi:hypothetical protein